MTFDVGALLDALDEHGVRSVIVGSVAARAHGVELAPNDLDIVPEPSPENLARLDALLTVLGGEPTVEVGEWQVDAAGERIWVRDGVPRPIVPRDVADPRTFDHSYETRLGRLDVVPEVAGGYEVLRPRAREAALDGRRALAAQPLDVLTGLTRPRRDRDGARVRQLREIMLRELPTNGDRDVAQAVTRPTPEDP